MIYCTTEHCSCMGIKQFSAGNYLIVGLIAEDGQKTIYVARQYYEIVNIPGEGWLRESDAECPF